MLKNKCLRCGYEWIVRISYPKQCPKCKSMNWNRPREEKKEETENDS